MKSNITMFFNKKTSPNKMSAGRLTGSFSFKSYDEKLIINYKI